MLSQNLELERLSKENEKLKRRISDSEYYYTELLWAQEFRDISIIKHNIWKKYQAQLRSLTNQEEVIKGHLKSEQEAFSDPKVEFEAQLKYKQMLQSVSGVDKTLGSVFKFFNCSLSISAEDRL